MSILYMGITFTLILINLINCILLYSIYKDIKAILTIVNSSNSNSNSNSSNNSSSSYSNILATLLNRLPRNKIKVMYKKIIKPHSQQVIENLENATN